MPPLGKSIWIHVVVVVLVVIGCLFFLRIDPNSQFRKDWNHRREAQNTGRDYWYVWSKKDYHIGLWHIESGSLVGAGSGESGGCVTNFFYRPIGLPERHIKTIAPICPFGMGTFWTYGKIEIWTFLFLAWPLVGVIVACLAFAHRFSKRDGLIHCALFLLALVLGVTLFYYFPWIEWFDTPFVFQVM